MRAVALIGGLSSVALVLQGCGGGGGGGGACVNTELKLVSQSFDATMKMEVKAAMQPPDPKIPSSQQNVDMDITQMIDVDKVNMYEKMSTDMELPGKEGKTEKVHVDSKLIFNAGKKEAVMKLDLSGAQTMSNCSKVVMKNMPDPSAIAQALKALPALMAQKLKCDSNDGTYDSWTMSLKLPDDSPVPLPAPYKDETKGTVSETMKLDKDYVLHSVSLKTDLTISMKIGNETSMTETEDMSMTTSNAKTGGPTDADLDYKDWGDCKEITPPGDISDIVAELSNSLSADDTHMPRVMSNSLFYRSIMQAVQISSEASKEVTV